MRGRGLSPAQTGSGTVRSPLELSEFALADGAPAVEPCSIEVEALATIARFVAQPLSLVLLIARRIHAFERAVDPCDREPLLVCRAHFRCAGIAGLPTARAVEAILMLRSQARG